MRWSMTGILFIGLLALAPATPRVLGAEQPALSKSDEAELKQLQKQRVATLARLVDVLTAQYKVGTVDYAGVHQARRELLDAKLDLAETRAERVAVLEQQIKAAKQSLDVVQMRFNAGRVSEADVCRARAFCLETEIKLVQERGKPAPPAR
jgi:outer membrane protein TolC